MTGLAAPVAFIVSTQDGASGGEDEQDRSLLYTYALGSQSRPTVNAFKGLSLAVRGALDSICGEKTRVMRLHQNTQGQAELVVSFAHMQLCIIALVLPGHITDGAAAGLVLHLAQSMVLLAGPSDSWLHTERDHKGRLKNSQLTSTARVLLDRLCDGLLHQLEGGAWNRVLPALLFESGVMYTQLPSEKQQQLEALIESHQNVGLTGWGNSPLPAMDEGNQEAGAGAIPFRFFKRNCCLMYRGTTVCSGLSPLHTKLIWQLCANLSIFSQEKVLPCQIITHKVYMGAPGYNYSSVDAQLQYLVPGAASTNMQPGQGLVAQEAMHQSSLLVLVSACHLLLAVLLTSYDEELDIEVTGQLEGQAAVELLHKLHVAYAADLDAASESNAFVQAASKPQSLDAALGTNQSAGLAKRDAAGHRNNLFMKLMGKAMGSPRASPVYGGALHGGQPTASESSFSRAKKWLGKPLAIASPTSREDSVVGTPDGQRGSISGTPKGSWFGRASPTGSSFTAPTDLGPLGPPATPASEKDSLDSPSSVKGKRQGSRFFVFPSSPSAVARQSLAVAPVFQWRGNRETMPPGPSVISFDAGLGRLQVSGDIAHMLMVPEVWRAVDVCRARLAKSTVAVSAPPKHSRLCMTLDQIEQVSATRSQREGGQRMGSADPAPWQYHPEVAALALVLQVTMRLRLPPTVQSNLPNPESAWYLTACKRNDDSELYICHTAEADEESIISEWSTPWAFLPSC